MTAESERALLGSVLLDPPVIDEIATLVTGRDFADADLGKMFDHVVVLHQAGIPVGDMAVLVPELRRAGLPEGIRSAAYLLQLIEGGLVCNVHRYAADVTRASQLRSHHLLAQEWIARTASPEADPDQLAAWVDSRLADLRGRTESDSMSIGEAANLYVQMLLSPTAQKPIVMSGIGIMDEAIGGWLPGELITLAARTGSGKSAMLIQIALHVAKTRPVLFVSLEMSHQELASRVINGRAAIDSRNARSETLSDRQKESACVAAESLQGDPIEIWAPPTATVSEIIARGKRAKATRGLGLLIVDYLAEITPDDPRRPRWEQVSALTRGLKVAARILDCPVLVAAQLNREADGSPPRLSHLRESGSIEQDSDVVMLLHRVSDTETQLRVAKHRHSAVGLFVLQFVAKETRFQWQRTPQPGRRFPCLL